MPPHRLNCRMQAVTWGECGHSAFARSWFARRPLHRLPSYFHGLGRADGLKGLARMGPHAPRHPPELVSQLRQLPPLCADVRPAAIAGSRSLLCATRPARIRAVSRPSARLAGGGALIGLSMDRATSWSPNRAHPPWWLSHFPSPLLHAEKQSARGWQCLRRSVFLSVMRWRLMAVDAANRRWTYLDEPHPVSAQPSQRGEMALGPSGPAGGRKSNAQQGVRPAAKCILIQASRMPASVQPAGWPQEQNRFLLQLRSQVTGLKEGLQRSWRCR